MTVKPEKTVLDNDIRVICQRMPPNPFVAFTGSICAGAASEKKRGVAELTSRLLLSGTKNRNSTALAEGIETLGATLDFRNTEETMHFYGRCPRASAPKLVAILVDCLSNPKFPNSELERVRGEILDEIHKNMDHTGRRAMRELLASLYPNHPYGRDPRGEVSDVKKVKRNDLVSFHSNHYGPKDMIIVFSGDVDDKFVKKEVGPVLSKFEGDSSEPRIRTPLPGKKISKVIPMPHKSQADIIIGLRTIPRHHKDFYALSMVNLLFGRIGMYGRLGFNIRDTQGLAYYSYSNLDAKKLAGSWNIMAGVNPGNLQKAIESIGKEIGRLHKEPLTEEEIAQGKDNQVGALKVSLERNAEMAGELYRIEYFDLGLDFLERFPGIVMGLTTEQIHKAAEKYIKAKHCSTVIAGPIERKLGKSLKLS